MTDKTNIELEDTGERMVPEFHKGSLIYAEHLTRYMVAQDIVKDKVVLDIASGSGYGTQLLAKHAKHVHGVDINEGAIAYAKKHFSAKNVTYTLGDGEKIPLEDNSVDVVITFETIEHIPDYKKFIDEVMRVLKPDGIAIVSTPNDKEFAEGNHYHLHEFEYKELVDLLKRDFKNIDSYYQATWKYVAVGQADLMETDANVEVETLQLAPLKRDQCLYFYLVCSNRTITEKIKPLAALGGHYSDREIIGTHMSFEAELEKRLDRIKELDTQVRVAKDETQVVREQLEQVQAQLSAITHSRSYRLANKLASVKHIADKPAEKE